jgi:hypothetical protein
MNLAVLACAAHSLTSPRRFRCRNCRCITAARPSNRPKLFPESVRSQLAQTLKRWALTELIPNPVAAGAARPILAADHHTDPNLFCYSKLSKQQGAELFGKRARVCPASIGYTKLRLAFRRGWLLGVGQTGASELPRQSTSSPCQ